MFWLNDPDEDWSDLTRHPGSATASRLELRQQLGSFSDFLSSQLRGDVENDNNDELSESFKPTGHATTLSSGDLSSREHGQVNDGMLPSVSETHTPNRQLKKDAKLDEAAFQGESNYRSRDFEQNDEGRKFQQTAGAAAAIGDTRALSHKAHWPKADDLVMTSLNGRLQSGRSRVISGDVVDGVYGYSTADDVDEAYILVPIRPGVVLIQKNRDGSGFTITVRHPESKKSGDQAVNLLNTNTETMLPMVSQTSKADHHMPELPDRTNRPSNKTRGPIQNSFATSIVGQVKEESSPEASTTSSTTPDQGSNLSSTVWLPDIYANPLLQINITVLESLAGTFQLPVIQTPDLSPQNVTAWTGKLSHRFDLSPEQSSVLYQIAMVMAHVEENKMAVWAPWGAWSNCSQDCGATAVRHRQCVAAAGLECQGPDTNRQPCPTANNSTCVGMCARFLGSVFQSLSHPSES